MFKYKMGQPTNSEKNIGRNSIFFNALAISLFSEKTWLNVTNEGYFTVGAKVGRIFCCLCSRNTLIRGN